MLNNWQLAELSSFPQGKINKRYERAVNLYASGPHNPLPGVRSIVLLETCYSIIVHYRALSSEASGSRNCQTGDCIG